MAAGWLSADFDTATHPSSNLALCHNLLYLCSLAQVFLAVVEEARDLLENDVQAPMKV